ncbi:MAG: hemolysin family protein [Spirochaetia bacterium]|nr:hemolysin family protein [Spirochaetia bacterium]
MLSELALMLLLILLNGFFSLAEMALMASRKARLRSEAEKGDKAYKMALDTAENPGRFLSTIQVAITLIGILTGAIGGATISQSLTAWLASIPALANAASALAVAIVVAVTTTVSVILGELVPKNLALSKPEVISAKLIRPMAIFSAIFYPLVKFLTVITEAIIKLLGLKANKEPEVTEEEVKVLIAQGTESGIFESSEKGMVEGVLELDDRRITSFMTPRTEVAALDLADPAISPLQFIMDHAQYAFLPAMEEDLDRIAGMIPVRPALAAYLRDRNTDIRSILVPPVFIPETISALRALAILRESKISTALIVDEYGGVSGLVTRGDLLGSVLSGINEGASAEIPGVVRRSDGSFLVAGALPIADFSDSLDLDETLFDTDLYDTVAGLVLACMGSIPKAGESCDWQNLHIEIMDMDGNRIDKVLVQKRDTDQPADQPL